MCRVEWNRIGADVFVEYFCARQVGEARQTDITLISVYLSAYEKKKQNKTIIILQRELVPERGRRKVIEIDEWKKTILFISPMSTQPIKTNERTKTQMYG